MWECSRVISYQNVYAYMKGVKNLVHWNLLLRSAYYSIRVQYILKRVFDMLAFTNDPFPHLLLDLHLKHSLIDSDSNTYSITACSYCSIKVEIYNKVAFAI